MIRELTKTLLLCTAVLSFPMSASAGLLARTSVLHGLDGTLSTWHFMMRVDVGDGLGHSWDLGQVTPQDIGSFWFAQEDTINDYSQLDWGAFRHFLTDGATDFGIIEFSYLPGHSWGQDELTLFSNTSYQLFDPVYDFVQHEMFVPKSANDLMGYVLTRIRFDLTRFDYFLKYGLYPATMIGYTLTFEGYAAPEPATVWLIGFGAIVFAFRRAVSPSSSPTVPQSLPTGAV